MRIVLPADLQLQNTSTLEVFKQPSRTTSPHIVSHKRGRCWSFASVQQLLKVSLGLEPRLREECRRCRLYSKSRVLACYTTKPAGWQLLEIQSMLLITLLCSRKILQQPHCLMSSKTLWRDVGSVEESPLGRLTSWQVGGRGPRNES